MIEILKPTIMLENEKVHINYILKSEGGKNIMA